MIKESIQQEMYICQMQGLLSNNTNVSICLKGDRSSSAITMTDFTPSALVNRSMRQKQQQRCNKANQH